MAERFFYGFNNSQDVIHLQTKYALFERVANILFSTVVDEGFDRELMTKAINLLFERNDCLRISFVKKNKKILQFFEEKRSIGNIPFKVFDTQSKLDAFLRKFRVSQVSPFKGETLKVVFAVNPDGKDMIIFKVSHFSADTYGIGVLVNDLFAVYKALRNGTEMPPAPGSFEEILRNDSSYRDNDEAVRRDEEFFRNYYEGKPNPVFCGITGNRCDYWLRQKRKGRFSIPYLFIRCDTTGYKLTIPALVNEKVSQWCEQQHITMSSFYFYVFSIAASLVNDKAPVLAPLMLLDCRGTIADRKAAGTKVQSISVYTTVDYGKSFNQNIAAAYADQNQCFRHTKLSYLGIESMQHQEWEYPMTHQLISFCYSFIPFSSPEGVRFQIHSNGKGSLTTYVALMYNVQTGELDVMYDIQDKMASGADVMEFNNLLVHVAETVLKAPDKNLENLF